MKRYFQIYILIIILVMTSCQNSNVTDDRFIIPQPDEFRSIDELDISYDVIKLQDDIDDALLGDVNNVLIFGNYIYCMEQGKTVHIFNTDGIFIKRFAKGRGPGELMMPMDMCIDYRNGNLNILSGIKIMEFSPEGDYIKTHELPAITYMEIEKCGDLYMLYSARYSEKNKKYFRIYNALDKQITPIIDAVNIPPIIGESHMVKSGDNGIYYNGMYGNIVYKLKDDENFGSIKCAFDNVAADEMLNISDFEEWSDSHPKYLRIGNFREFANGLWGLTVSKKTRYQILYNPEKQVAYELEHIKGLVYVGFDGHNDYYMISPISVLTTNLANIKSANLKNLFTKLYELSENNEDGNNFLVKLNYKL